MKALIFLIFTLILSLLLSMALAIYLPFDNVNRMFIAGLSVTIIFPLTWVCILLIERQSIRISIFALSLPILFLMVYIPLTATQEVVS